MFIHWGLYALSARHEWVKSREQMTDEAYERYFRHFDPALYDPVAWARAAREAGMRYVVLTTKHHEGFCLWDSRYTDYKVTNTPYGRDLLRPFVVACRSEGLRVGFYHSLIDWHHPDFPIDRIHPMRDDAEFREREKDRDIRRYTEYLHNQVRELLTEFGEIACMFFDFSYPGEDGKGRDDWQSEKLLAMVRELQPHCLVNDRLDLLDLPGGWDYRTPEQVMIREGLRDEAGRPILWETCQTFSGSWGYHRDETTWKSVEQLVQMLIDTVSKGGNLLLNVGPTARGEFDRRATDRLQGIGEWMKRHSRAIYGCGPAPAEFSVPQDSRLTYSAATNRLYVHLFNWPVRTLHLDGFAGRVEYARLLNDGSEIRFHEQDPHLSQWVGADTRSITLELPIEKPDAVVPVIELFLK
ncbi:MAG TPA: alpha-L-fucosidase [Chloroflexi bacterium]|jgi:alpha-L-fucosidase|nr:alpha-L-fucosidase [Chloroflexota bacterium]